MTYHGHNELIGSGFKNDLARRLRGDNFAGCADGVGLGGSGHNSFIAQHGPACKNNALR